MKKVIRITESDLTNIIRRVIVEQQENSEQCQKFAKKRNSYKAKGERIIRLAPNKLRGMLTSIFNIGLEKGPQAFKNAIPQEMKSEFQKKIATLKKPKSEMELDALLSDVENEVENIQEQFAPQTPYFMAVVMGLSVLLILVVLIWGMEEAPLCSSYRG
jgi:hypothetical protein